MRTRVKSADVSIEVRCAGDVMLARGARAESGADRPANRRRTAQHGPTVRQRVAFDAKRALPDRVRPSAQPFGGVSLDACLSLTDLEQGTSRSTAIASTGIGVYRQPLGDVLAADCGVNSYCWAFALLRRAGV